MNLHYLKSPLGDDPLIVDGLFRAPVNRVFMAWTDPERLLKWFGPKAGALLTAEVNLTVGGQWRFVFSDGPDGKSGLEGEYQTIEPDRRLVYSWRQFRDHPDGTRTLSVDSQVTVTFEPAGAATRVQLRHEGLSSDEPRRNAGGGWSRSFANLAAFVEDAA